MNVNFSEIVVVFLVALLLFGPEQLPQIARQLGKVAADFRKGSQAIRREWYNSVYPPAEEVRRDLALHSRELSTLKAEVMAPPAGSIGTAARKSPEPTSIEGTPPSTPHLPTESTS